MDRPLPNPDDLQLLVKRFHRARWITGASMVSPEPFSMDLTPLGLRRLRQLFEVYSGLKNRDNFPDEGNLRAKESGALLMDHFLEAMSDLFPPFLSPGEKETLLGLTMFFAKRHSW